MEYYSLNKSSPVADFREATLRGLAPDKGLYFPAEIPKLEKNFIEKINNYSNEEIGFRVIKPYVSDVISENELRTIIKETIDFEIPLVKISENIFSLELFHGPTMAFKDIGARFMSRCLSYFVKNNDKKITVLVATSGDTGAAVANGFYNVDGVEVVILYPSGKVSMVQEKQLTTLGNNIHALEINGNFDDCQKMVKQAFADQELNKKLFLTSANSINVARWLPQQFYYFFAWKQWQDKNDPPVVSVPSGNFGNICAGILAYFSGLPVHQFIAACNANNTVPEFLKTENYQSKKAVATISNAMDVGDPSNFVRVLELFHHQFSDLKNLLSSYSVSDEQTRETIKEVFQKENYLADPHGAVGYFALQKYLQQHPNRKGIFLETAHPVKFYDVVEPVIQQNIPVPELLQPLMKKEKISIYMDASFANLREFLLNR
ncbi:MAG: threonine synthase [Bacteroidota bacterium]|nr:threonine synthase [Bacteroidota bacterium]